MFAEITVTAAEPLSPSLEAQAREWFHPLAPPYVAIGVTELSDMVVEEIPPIVGAMLPPGHAVVVFRRDARRLRAHVELVDVPTDMQKLKTVAEEAAQALAEFLEAHGNRSTSALIRIHAEKLLIATGRRHSWIQRLIASARKEIAGRLSVPVATFLASLWFDSDVRRATVSAVAGFCGVAVWLLVSATLEEQGYRYE